MPGSSSRRARRFFAGLSYYGILSAAYPGEVAFWPIVTAYAVGVSMNNFLPANIGTFVTLLMFVAIIPSATVGGSFAAYLVQKIFFTIVGTFVYLYLFLSVPGSFHESLGNISDHPARTILIVAGGGFLIVLVGRIFWRQVKKLWAQAKQGGVILATPKRYLTRAFLPSLASWLCKLTVIGIFLAAFAIPVTFESIMWITGSGSLANVVSFTPGAVGITQATNALALNTCCDVANEHAVAYSTRAAVDHHGLERRVRARAHGARLRLDRRQGARRWRVRRREGQGRRAEGAAGREEAGQAGREGRGVTTAPSPASYGEAVSWEPERPRFKPLRLLLSWVADGGVAVGGRGDPARRRHRGSRRRLRLSPPSLPC